MRRKYCSYSPGIRKISKDGINIINNIDKNINFHKKNSNNNNIKKYNYNLLSDNVLKFVSNSNFYFHYDYRNKNFKPNKKFIQKKNDKNEKNTINNTNNINSINSINNDNYFRTNNNIKNKNNDEKKLFQSSMNNPLTRKSFDYCLSSNTSKKKHLVADKKINNNINDDNKNNINYLFTNNFNVGKTTKNNISKKSFGNLKGNNYLNSIFSDNTKPILINTSHIRKNTCTTTDKTNPNINNKNNANNKINPIIPNKKSKSKSKNIKNTIKNNTLSNRKNNLYNKDNLDNNIIINVNFLKPNIILDHQRTSSRKTKNNRTILNQNMTTGAHNNHFIPSKVDRPVTESNFCSTVRNNYFNRSNKNKNNNNIKNYNNYKNIDMKQIKNSKEINQIIKSIQEMNKNQGNYNNNNNNKKRMNTEL